MHLKILTTRRPDPRIRNAIRQHRNFDPESIRLMGEDDSEMEAIASEISLVIKARIRKLQTFRLKAGIDDDAHVALQNGIRNRTYL